jgi:hypothetical protein
MWPDVQKQDKVTKGVYTFMSAGHGGLVAVLDAADLPADAVTAARATGGLIYTVAVARHGRSVRMYSTVPGDSRNSCFTREALEQFAANNPGRVTLHDVWVGEEDCGWATLALVSSDIRDGLIRLGAAAGSVTGDAPYTCVQRFNEEFLVAYDPFYTIADDGPIAARRERYDLLASDQTLRAAAINVGGGQVHVLFCGNNGREEFYLMDTSTYRAVGLLENATPDTYRQHGPITEAAGPLGHPVH